MSDEERKRIPPPPLVPEWIRMRVIRKGVQIVLEVPKAYADKPVPFCPVLDFSMMHGATIFRALNPEDQG